MDSDLMAATAVISQYEERFQRADARIADALARLAHKRPAREQTPTGAFGFARPSVQTLVWE
jgi:hypothetical protein